VSRPGEGEDRPVGPGGRVDAQALALSLAQAGVRLHQTGLLGGLAGNLSVRIDAETMLITPRGAHKGHLEAEDMVVLSLDAGPDEAAAASTEYPFHRESYRARAAVGGVVHTHAPALIAAGIRDLDIAGTLPEVSLATGDIVTLPLLESGSEALGTAVGEAVERGAGVILLRRHGAIAVGADLAEAVNRMELAELAAYAALMAEDGGAAADQGRVALLDRLAQ